MNAARAADNIGHDHVQQLLIELLCRCNAVDQK
jgi:hypothetical protein